ncbi:uncharacterized protein LOC127876669 [Dreissena polymorpha]|uniref:Uncharacterized protein n=1 Tax=Dreissena polymorpha TaxID=45954 RepID=A0A9D4KIV2_DREPO|nr:uncharacterized protein LOC127876669 [Dreissena polymorpha]XP_052277992.1 uncharacterized protein LOC127876669 [Dreissena polymorpha]XP_052277993.1 uncharacterized protein LOC127876669 [Dreissena polymorpha]XP_052277994.1 uncharacterized protein LOC127876669 [Dreissena polymorpha]XP_052277995.1 uncharacterized protein LOC127876669 [Dreissena polymorpha]XP_052277996.1 uncharacterized protein LOC127876669 [Dreissena polymorpha]KAH3840340.1 hypothetical protein DPMN_113787 [Dreissena polymorp
MRSRIQLGVVAGMVGAVVLLSVVILRRPGDLLGGTSCVQPPEPVYGEPLFRRSIDVANDDESVSLQNTLRDERNKLSKDLNEMKQTLGRMDCEKEESKTNSAGGWCKKASSEDGGEHMTDMPLIKKLTTFLKGKKVGSFGDGPGAYKRELLKLGDVSSYDAYDGAPYCEETSEGRVRFMDLTVPQYGISMYDWIISLEVAEHIPKSYEPVYIANIVRHSREGIIISWARPGQGGLAHINNRPLSYVVSLMEHHGFFHDKNASNTLQMASSFGWLRDNLNVFRREKEHNLKLIEQWYT